jgi:hypothetical protein
MGYYKCIRCGGTDTYKSTETTGFNAISIDNPGPIDQTFVSANKSEITRCRACGEKAQYIMSAVESANARKSNVRFAIGMVIGFGALIIWLFNGGFDVVVSWIS